MNRSRLGGWQPLLVFLIAICGCTNANRPLNDVALPLESRRENHTRAEMFSGVRAFQTEGELPTTQNSWVSPSGPGAPAPFDKDGYFVGLALSGGGSRSANFSAACMFQLQRLGLLQRVDYISALSGGSLPAAYYCAHDAEWNPENVQKVLTHPFASDLIDQGFLPWNWFAFMFTDWDRSDLLAGIFRNVLFTENGHELTFADLRPDRPRLLINVTDLQSGRRLVFSDELFDQLNSDLAKYPLAYAVAASSSIPVVLHPVTLRDYSTRFRQYRHVIDGGINDNLGIQTLLDTYSGQLAAAKQAGRPDPYPNGAVFIVVDAGTRFNAELSSESDIGALENLKIGTALTTNSMIQRVNQANMSDLIVRGSADDLTAKELRATIRKLVETGYLDMQDIHGHRVRVLHLSLGEVNDLQNLPFENFSTSLNSIGTYFNITEREAYRLYQAAELLVRDKFESRIGEIVADLDRGATTRPSR